MPPDRVAAVAVGNEVEAALPTAANATTGGKLVGTETIVVAEAATEDKVALRAAEAMARGEDEVHNAVAPPMEASEGPKASAPAMPITVHHVISERLVPLNGRKTERT